MAPSEKGFSQYTTLSARVMWLSAAPSSHTDHMCAAFRQVPASELAKQPEIAPYAHGIPHKPTHRRVGSPFTEKVGSHLTYTGYLPEYRVRCVGLCLVVQKK